MGGFAVLAAQHEGYNVGGTLGSIATSWSLFILPATFPGFPLETRAAKLQKTHSQNGGDVKNG